MRGVLGFYEIVSRSGRAKRNPTFPYPHTNHKITSLLHKAMDSGMRSSCWRIYQAMFDRVAMNIVKVFLTRLSCRVSLLLYPTYRLEKQPVPLSFTGVSGHEDNISLETENIKNVIYSNNKRLDWGL